MISASNDDAESSECVTHDKLLYLKNRWSCMCDRMHLWLQKLNSSLPGVLGQIGDWLCRSEECLRAMPSVEYDSPSSAVKGIQQQLADISVKCLSAVCLLNKLFAYNVFLDYSHCC